MSVVIIFFNEVLYLQEAIGSVFAQSYTHWELLLVDDGSDDGSTSIARTVAARYPERVTYLEHSGHANRGMSAARNLGIRHARGEYVAFLDADDVWFPHTLERQARTLEGNSRLDMVYGDAQLWYSWTGRAEEGSRDCSRGVGIAPSSVIEAPGLLTRCYPLGPAPSPAMGTFLVRRRTLERVGGCEITFRGLFEDQALLAKLYLAATVAVSDECFARYRMHERSCVSRSVARGSLDDATYGFLKWLAAYLRSHGSYGRDVRRRLRRAMRPFKYPRLHELGRRANRRAGRAWDAIWGAGNRTLRAAAGKSTGVLTATPDPVITADRFSVGAITLEWWATKASAVEVRASAPGGPLVARAGLSGSTATGILVADGMRFYLQDVSDGLPLTKANTIATIRIETRRSRPLKAFN